MGPLKAILLDLDDTLLQNNMETFLPGYFRILGRFVAAQMDADVFINHLIWATNQVVAKPDPQQSNMERLLAHFAQVTGLQVVEQVPLFEEFYQHHFPQLKGLTQPEPIAVPLVEFCLRQGWQVVVATNPLFPQTAIEQRLAWAGLPVTDYPFTLVTTMENMHATKPHAAYYLEILHKIDVPAENALMVGDNWVNDIEPAFQVGMQTYWIQLQAEGPPDPQKSEYWGNLAHCYQLLQTGAYA